MSKFTFAIALFLSSLFVTVSAAPFLLVNSLNYPTVVVELTKDDKLQLEEEKIIRYKLRHQYTITCGLTRYGVIHYRIDPMYRIEMSLLSGQEVKVSQRCSVERGQPTKSYYLKANPK